MQFYHSGLEHIQIGNLDIKPFSRLQGAGDTRLMDMQLITANPYSQSDIQVCCAPADLLYYDDPLNPTNVDVPHRYFHPPATNGVDMMLLVPKFIIRMPAVATVGEAMCITWFFWTSWQQMAELGSPLPDEAPIAILSSYATDIVTTYEPITETPWEPPVLAPLPPDFALLAGPERIKALMKRA